MPANGMPSPRPRVISTLLEFEAEFEVEDTDVDVAPASELAAWNDVYVDDVRMDVAGKLVCVVEDVLVCCGSVFGQLLLKR